MRSLRFFPSLVFLALTASLQADLLYEESFSSMRFPLFEDGMKNYGGYAGNTGSSAGADGDLVSGSLNFVDSAGNALVTSGKHVLVDADEEAATVSNIHGLASPWNITGNTIWVSFIGRQTAGTNARFFNLGLRSSSASPSEVIAIGIPTGVSAQFWRIYDKSGGLNSNFVDTNVPPTTQVFALVRMESNVDATDRERYTLWLNPRLDQAPDEAAGFTFTSLVSDISSWNAITDIRLAAGGPQDPAPASAWEVDEIRIATTKQEVTPYLAMQVTNVQLDANGSTTISWTATPGAQDTVEWSSNLVDWEPYIASRRIIPPEASIATWTTPPSNLTRLYLRVKRTAPVN